MLTACPRHRGRHHGKLGDESTDRPKILFGSELGSLERISKRCEAVPIELGYTPVSLIIPGSVLQPVL